MVEHPQAGETFEDIAARYDVETVTVRHTWSGRPDFPAPIGKRDRRHLYDPQQVDQWYAAAHPQRESPGFSPAELYTAAEIEVRTGITAATIRAEQSKGHWPTPDPEHKQGRANAWPGSVINEAVRKRRAYGRRPAAK